MVMERINARMGDDLLDRAKKEARDRGITFSELLRGSLRNEIKHPTPIREVRELRQRVDEIEEALADAVVAVDAVTKNNREDIGEILRILEEIDRRSK